MAEGREGYARLISKIATANPESLARQDDPQDLANRLLHDERLEGLRQELMRVLEKITEIQLANSADIMSYVDAYTNSLQAARTRDAALDASMKEVDDWNKRFGKGKGGGGEDDVPPAPLP